MRVRELLLKWFLVRGGLIALAQFALLHFIFLPSTEYLQLLKGVLIIPLVMLFVGIIETRTSR